LTRLPGTGYRMGMARRLHIGSRVVILVAVASTLLATWLPPARACACESATTAAVHGGTGATAAPADSCPCCCNQPDDAIPPCCRAHHPAATRDGSGSCGCASPAQPDDAPPAAPPRSVDPDEVGSPTAADIGTVPASPRPPAATPAVEAARGRAGPPPVDLIISLSRLTC
jgi:hypothetical protein